MSLNTQRVTHNDFSIDANDANTPLSQRCNMMTLQHNLSMLTTSQAAAANASNHVVLKQEIILLRKQLNDARSSQLFLKK